jgi:hypothetical protein
LSTSFGAELHGRGSLMAAWLGARRRWRYLDVQGTEHQDRHGTLGRHGILGTRHVADAQASPKEKPESLGNKFEANRLATWCSRLAN